MDLFEVHFAQILLLLGLRWSEFSEQLICTFVCKKDLLTLLVSDHQTVLKLIQEQFVAVDFLVHLVAVEAHVHD